MTHLAMWEGLAEGLQAPETEWAEHVIEEYSELRQAGIR